MRKFLMVGVVGWAIFGGAVLSGAQDQPPPPPPSCTPTQYIGVDGCEMTPEGGCPVGYHKQAACPKDPRMKAPCRMICVADAKPGKKSKPDAPSPEEKP